MINIKKSLMLMVWRFQQVNSMIMIVGLSLTLSFQLYPHLDDWFVAIGIPRKLDWLIMLIIFILTFLGAVICGIIYDVFLKLWIQQQIVTIERQPFAKEKANPKLIINWRYFWIPILKKNNCKAEAEFVTKWVEHNVLVDKNIQRDVERIIDWINEYELKPEDKRWLKKIENKQNSLITPNIEDVIE